MPKARPIVDVEALVVQILRADTATLALAGAGRIAREIAAGADDRSTWVTARRVAGLVDENGHLEEATVQLDAWGPSRDATWALFTAADLALRLAAPNVYELHDGTSIVVSNVQRVAGPTWLPDPDTGHPRYSTDVIIAVHPAAG